MSLKFGVIVARFQVHKLHDGHIHLIDSVYKKCDEVIILLGEPEERNLRNPLSFELRKQMIQEIYPKAFVFKLMDINDNAHWSKRLDDALLPFSKYDITLFGSRDSFRNCYFGMYPYEEIPELKGFSGTDEREKLLNLRDYSLLNENFRAGVIYGYTQALQTQKENIE